MRLLDALLGRTRPVPANLDRLFALPSAGVTLKAALDFAPTGVAGVCFKPADGADFAASDQELLALLGVDHIPTQVIDDKFGYRWVLLRAAGLDDLVTAAHAINSTLTDHGYGSQLLCSAFGFASREPVKQVLLVYLYKRGTFYPFAPTGPQQRDTQLELSIRAELRSDLPIEAELTRWFALWDAPVLPGRDGSKSS